MLYIPVNIMPYWFIHWLSWGLTFGAFSILRMRRRETVDRIQEVLKLSPAQTRRIAWESYFNIIAASLEFLRFRQFSRIFSKGYIAVEGLEHIKKLQADGTGAVLAAMHSGSWEISGAAVEKLGFHMFYVTGILHNPYADRLINRMRTAVGVDLIPRKGALKNVFRRLKRGELLGIVADQHVAGDSLEIAFFDRPVKAPKGPAAFARKSGVPIIPFVTLRERTRHHRVLLLDPIWPDESLSREEDIQRMTCAYHAVFENMVRQNPGNWFWLHRRWRKKGLNPAPQDQDKLEGDETSGS